MTFKKRSYQSELLDEEDIPTEDLYRNLRELDFINRWLGGHAVILDGLKQFIKRKPIPSTIQITEIGSGGGDNLRAVGELLKNKNIPYKLSGIDLKEDCVRFAESQQIANITFHTSDYQLVSFPDSKPHIIFNSLFCHHFQDDALIKMLQWMKENSQVGFFLADLHRHPLAYFSIKFLTRLFSKSYLVKNDAPLSVLRGFSRKEWENLLEKAEIKEYDIQWKWAFRWLIVVRATS